MDRSNETVSVIVPVYNAQKYLRKCLASILAQSYRDLQIILVDDGSTDQSLKICRAFAEKDRRVQVFTQENRGVSAARNLGLEHVSGKYLSFVDADDWLPREAVSILVHELAANNAQYVVGEIVRVLPIRNLVDSVKEASFSRDSHEADQSDLKIAFFSEGLYYSLIAKKMLLSSIIIENHLSFRTEIKLGEDGCFMLDYLKYCDTVCCCNKPVYYYNRLYDGNGTLYHPERNQWNLIFLQKLNETSREFLRKEDSDRVVQKKAINTFLHMCRWYMQNCANEKEAKAKVCETITMLERFAGEQSLLCCAEEEQRALYFAIKKAVSDEEEFHRFYVQVTSGEGKKNRLKRAIRSAIERVLSVIKYFWYYCIRYYLVDVWAVK